MDYIAQTFSVRFSYRVFFTRHLFSLENVLFRDFLTEGDSPVRKKMFFVIDEGVLRHHAKLMVQIRAYFASINNYDLIDDFMIVPGGEQVKNTEKYFHDIVHAVDRHSIDRHSYIAAIGGGAVLDLVGYAAAVSHRGVKHIRIPTTVLSQNDSGVGVKNGINYRGKKNFLGTFVPPVAVFNDSFFLTSLSAEDWRSGMSEAVKVALIKDRKFFEWLKQNASLLAVRNEEAMQYLVKRCAELHLQHIAAGDPFEMGSSRPLDFGHWSAHKLEQLSNFKIRHGEAVAMGIALDSAYSFLSGRLSEDDAREVISLLKRLGFSITHEWMQISGDDSPVLVGLQEFREHLGGQLTIMLLEAIGKGVEVHEMDPFLLKKASEWVTKNR
ncbi:MAG: 3-dehydroquinate synthase [Chitinophagaceae bacterium]|nr:3-dehydroquinate synthase [Chitinophagaceae bacterium]